ncbi:hypothetical protein [Sulfuriroseicoccus oceanibius]|uniref:Uncharacterized protein n=1 Tax=Sulfuriroseicoccus oceanibius TaxID=2707525 RepID=A0A6B3L1I5_9BACT|nr:hypothetical protein [Sulfuriroseicoccus oceanibius]QQL43896.1 hypothetical protein G3M56_008300 [Sulfuriroseicoccus oceanibius]
MMNPLKTSATLGTAALLAAGSLHAQVFPAPTAPASQPQGGNGNTTIVNQQQPQSGPATPFGNEIPVFDASTENVMFNGNTWNVNDQRVFAARIESYLNTPPVEIDLAKEYYETLGAIPALLTHGGISERKANYPKALALLKKASEYKTIDNGISSTLYNHVFQIWLVNRDISSMQRELAQIDKAQKDLQWRGDMKATELPLTGQQNGSGNDKQGGGGPPAGVGTQSLLYQDIILERSENVARKKLLQAQQKTAEIKAKTEYHVFMAQLFLQRRFEHCVIAGRFYNHIFNDGEATLKLKKNSDVGKLFSDTLGGSPTVSTLDGMANESIGEVKSKMRAVDYLVSQNELWSAYKRLQEAFIIGEYLEPVRLYDLGKKRKLHKFAQKRYRLLNAMSAKDYGSAEELLKELYEAAPDFDGAKEESWIKSQMLASNMALKKAQNLFFQNKTEDAEQQVKTAVEIWPSNPNLDEFIDQTSDQLGEAKLRNDYERLKAEGNYDMIVQDIGQYLAAFRNDEAKLKEINEVATNASEIRQAIELSKRAESSSSPFAEFAAWEEIQILRKRFPTDSKLALRSEELTQRVAVFADTLRQAKFHEQRGRRGSALAHYMKARQAYPDSKIARDGVERMIDQVMQQGSNTDTYVPADNNSSAPVDPF